MSIHGVSTASASSGPSERLAERSLEGPQPLPREAVVARHPAAELLEMVAECCAAPTLNDATRQLATRLPALFPDTRVILGLTDRSGQNCHVAASSEPWEDVGNPEHDRLLEAALDEALRGGEPRFEPVPAGISPAPCPTLRALADHWRGAALATMPLCLPGRSALGVLLLVRLPGGPWSADTASRLRACGHVLASILPVVQRAHQGPWRRLAEQTWVSFRRRKNRFTLAALALLSFALAVPWPYRMNCPCTVEPIVRRYVVAPFAGKLDEALVQPGDVVQAGQILARMDGHEIEWELAGLEAERGRAEKRHEAALATRAATAAQLARLEMQQHEMRIRTLEERREHLTIRSPLAGIVVRGDIERSANAPLSVGQSLFEIAPLEQMIAEIAIPESEVAHFGTGSDVALRLEAFPRRVWTGRISRLHPRSELRDGDSVFLAELEVLNADGRLHPGMRGQARLTGARHALGWNLFHRAIDRAYAWVGW